MVAKRISTAGLMAGLALTAVAVVPTAAAAQPVVASDSDGVHAGQLDVAVNKSQVLRVDRPYAKALVGNPGSREHVHDMTWRNSHPFRWHSEQLMELGLMEPGQWF